MFTSELPSRFKKRNQKKYILAKLKSAKKSPLLSVFYDQGDIWETVKKILLPYSSFTCEQIIAAGKDNRNRIKKKEIQAKKRRERNIRRRQQSRLKQQARKKLALGSNLNEKDQSPTDRTTTEIPEVKGEMLKEGTPVTPHMKLCPELVENQPSCPPEPAVKIELVRDSEKTNTLPTVETPIRKKATRKKPKRKPKSKTHLAISRGNFEILDTLFSPSSSHGLSINAFDNLVKSPSGFCGRIFGGRHSQMYEVYLLNTRDGTPLDFMTFVEFQQAKKLGKNVEKYRFSLHRPHARGKNKQGKTRYMYPALIELARTHLERLKLTPETIKPYKRS